MSNAVNSALDDLLLVLEWLSSTKTPPININAAMERIRERAKVNVPIKLDLNLDGKTIAEDVKDIMFLTKTVKIAEGE